LITSAYKNYRIVGNCQVITDNYALAFRTSENNGSSFNSGATDYSCVNNGFGSSAENIRTSDDDEITISISGIGNDTGEGIDFEFTLFDPSGTSQRKRAVGQSVQTAPDGTLRTYAFAGQRKSVNAINAVRIQTNGAGSNLSGTVSIYGLED
jgi:hypothetical protein